jgi:predicted phage baseplate assembly protein
LYTLQSAPLTWLLPDDPNQLPSPEVVLTDVTNPDKPVSWQYLDWLIDAESSERAFTVDPARFVRIRAAAGASNRFDYDGDAGDTLRFGDGVFGALPAAGTVFGVTYRVTRGSAGNIAADSIFTVNDSRVVRVTNPLSASGGADPETLDSVRRNAPQAFRTVQYRAVLPPDYQAVAQTLPWVLRAGSVFRWTGSWLTVFTTPDPIASELFTSAQRLQLIDLLGSYRMAGCESYVSDPEYLSIDLIVLVGAQPNAFKGAVEQAVLTALGTGPGGFFTHDNFTFGQPLEKSSLEAVVQSISGVAGVLDVRYRFSGRTTGFASLGDAITLGSNQIVRCDNDPSLPGSGSLKVIVQGGK